MALTDCLHLLGNHLPWHTVDCGCTDGLVETGAANATYPVAAVYVNSRPIGFAKLCINKYAIGHIGVIAGILLDGTANIISGQFYV